MIAAAFVLAAAPITVVTLIADHDALAGRRVQLRGWIVRECVARDCHLYAARGGGAHVSIGHAAAFDAAVRPALGHEVVIDATVTSRCWPDSSFRCLDRGDPLADPNLVRILP